MKLKKAEESEIQIDVKEQQNELQRTEQWQEDRRGRWTGSQLKSLMTCAQGKSKLDWDNLDKLLSIGKTAIKYIYENAMERKTGRYIDEGAGTVQMRYGTKVEPLITKIAKKKLKKYGKMKLVGFKKFDSMPNAGVSSDAIVVDRKTKKTIASVEMKACTNWQTHFERTFGLVEEGGKDFWQIQGQTIAHDVDTCYYIVAEPPSDIGKYLYYPGDIMELYQDFLKDCPVRVIEVKASKTHQEALLKRIALAEDALNDWLATDEGSLMQSLETTIETYHKKPKLFEQYVPPLPFRDEVKKKKRKRIVRKKRKKKS